MSAFDWKKLKFWKVGHAIFEVVRVNEIPKRYKGSSKCPVVDIELKKIFMLPKHMQTFYQFMENLWHELDHAQRIQNSREEIEELRSTEMNRSRVEKIEEIEVELSSMSNLSLMSDNLDEIQYMINQYRKRRKK